MVGFLMLWLKQCVVPSLPKAVIAIDVVYLAMLLAHDRSLGLLLAMVCNLLNGLRELHYEFSKVETLVNDEGRLHTKLQILESNFHIHIKWSGSCSTIQV